MGNIFIGQKSTGEPQFYRFDKPKNPEFPQMIELFARTEWVIGDEPLIPVHIDDSVSSLSAILLNEEYYETLLLGRDVIDGISILKPTYLIPFKAKAWLDLKTKKNKGWPLIQEISKNIRMIFKAYHFYGVGRWSEVARSG